MTEGQPSEPSLKVISKEGPQYKILIEGVSSAVANTLRRALLAYVPTLAVEEVVFMENNTSFYREYIAHRLALVPIITQMSYEELADNFDNPQREVDMYLDVKADSDLVVYASELKFPDGSPATAHPKIPLISLVKGQNIKAEIRARMGSGREHAKWQPVSATSVVAYPKIEIKNEDCRECAEACPTGALAYEDGKLVVKNLLACDLCGACVEANPEAVEVGPDDDKHVMSFEVNGQLDARTAMMAALEILNRELNNIMSQLEVLLNEKKAD